MALVIKRGVRANGRLYLPGEEAALAAVLAPHQIKYLKSRGALEENWQEPFAGSVTGFTNPLPQSPGESGNVLTAEGDGVEREGAQLLADGETHEASFADKSIDAEFEEEMETDDVQEEKDNLSVLDAIGVDIAQLLADGGFDTIDKIRAATDSQLNALPKIGPATVKRIREALK